MIKTKEYALPKPSYRKYIRKELMKNYKALFLLTIAAFIGIGSLSAYGYLNLGNNKILEAWLPFLIIIVIFWLYILVYVPYATSNSKINRLSFNNWQYTFDEISFLAESDEEHKISAKYSTIPKISKNKDYFMLYFNCAFALLVTKEAFYNESDFNEVTNNF